jgi:hypothetical protein
MMHFHEFACLRPGEVETEIPHNLSPATPPKGWPTSHGSPTRPDAAMRKRFVQAAAITWITCPWAGSGSVANKSEMLQQQASSFEVGR